MDLEDEFGERFRGCLSPEKREEWEGAKSRLFVGRTASGDVISLRPFGVFVDVGVGFPALLEVIEFEQAREKRYTATESYPAIGEIVTARVVQFNDRNRQIALTQRVPHPFLDRESTQS